MNQAQGFLSPAVVMAGFALMMGISVALIAWLISRSMATVPDEDREYKDPPPVGFRFVWLPIQWISFYLDMVLSDKIKISLHTKLRKGGLDYSISPSQFLAARFIGAAVMGLVFWWLLGSFERADGAGFSDRTYIQTALAGALLGWFYPLIWLHDRLGSRRRELLKSFPFYLDIITLCVEAGLNLQGAMRQAVAKGPKGVMRDELQRVQRDIRAGKARVESLRAMADRLNEPAITNFVIAVIQAESMGMNMGPVLRAQADQRRTERFLRAEKLAMEAPVKMLFPLIAFIFPCTFIVLAFPIVMKFLESGL
jgi:tight adherence protein C